MSAPRFVVKVAASVVAAAVLAIAWRAWTDRVTYRAEARIEVLDRAPSALPTEIAVLERLSLPVGISVRRVEGTNLLAVSMVADDPGVASHAVNSLTDNYLTQHRARRDAPTEAQVRAVAAEVEAQAVTVRAAERELTEARTLIARTARERQTAASSLRSLEASLTRTQATLAGLKPLYAQITGGRSPETLCVVQNTQIIQVLKGRLSFLAMERAGLLERYGPEHPLLEKNANIEADVRAQLDTEVWNVIRRVTQDYENAQRDAQWLEGERDKALLLSTQRIPTRNEYAWLFERAQRERAAYLALQRRQQEVTQGSHETEPGVRLVGWAVPVRDTQPSRQAWGWGLVLLAALAVGFAVPPVVGRVRRRMVAARHLKGRHLIPMTTRGVDDSDGHERAPATDGSRHAA